MTNHKTLDNPYCVRLDPQEFHQAYEEIEALSDEKGKESKLLKRILGKFAQADQEHVCIDEEEETHHEMS